jgi:hypothetical protein
LLDWDPPIFQLLPTIERRRRSRRKSRSKRRSRSRRRRRRRGGGEALPGVTLC